MINPYLNTFGLIAYSWVILLIPQLVLGPLLLRLGGAKDGFWAWGRLVGWLLVSLIVWFLGYLKLPINTQAGVTLVSLSLLLIALWLWPRLQLKALLNQYKHFIILEEILFALGFGWLALVRSFNPNILDLEKFMDHGFIASYLRSPTLPASDMWLVGHSINYYSFGHFMGSIATRWWGLDPAYSYNLLLALICGLTLVGSFSVILNLTAGRSLLTTLGALVGAFLVVFGGNSHTLWYWLSHRTLEGYWYAEATRFIPFTIHEFPAYSFVVSDLHGHVWDLPIVLFFLAVFAWWTRHRHLKLAAILGVLLGVMFMTNSWDALIYSLLLAVYGSGQLRQPKQLSFLIKTALVVGLTALITALPWMLSFQSITQGIRLVQIRSPLWQLAALWGSHVFLASIAFLMCLRFKGRLTFKHGFIIAIFITSLILLLIPEIIYFKDIYPNHPRANTMFKFTFQAFILMSLLIGWAITRFKLWPLTRKNVGYGLLAVVFLGFLNHFFLFPTFAYRNYYNDFKNFQGLDGLTWLSHDYPDDYQAILWLKQVPGLVPIVEAVGESYTVYGRVSALTGLPTILGWRVHEWLWRGGFDIPAARTEEVKTIFEKPTSQAARNLLDKYKVGYIFLGSKEREEYLIPENDLVSLGKVVFQSGSTKIIQVNQN